MKDRSSQSVCCASRFSSIVRAARGTDQPDATDDEDAYRSDAHTGASAYRRLPTSRGDASATRDPSTTKNLQARGSSAPPDPSRPPRHPDPQAGLLAPAVAHARSLTIEKVALLPAAYYLCSATWTVPSIARESLGRGCRVEANAPHHRRPGLLQAASFTTTRTRSSGWSVRVPTRSSAYSGVYGVVSFHHGILPTDTAGFRASSVPGSSETRPRRLRRSPCPGTANCSRGRVRGRGKSHGEARAA